MLISQLADMTAYTHPTAMFTVHVGDMQKPDRTFCVEAAYAEAAQYLQSGPLPTYVIAGDNDWADCPDPYQALGYYHKYFDYFERNWPNTTTTTVPRMIPNTIPHTQKCGDSPTIPSCSFPSNSLIPNLS